MFQYEPLDLSKSRIRLLDLLPESEPGVIRCVIKNYNLLAGNTIFDPAREPSSAVPGDGEDGEDGEAGIAYSCLSYEWGVDDVCCQIELNGSLFAVRRNLFDFFQCFQAQQAGKGFNKLWIDAICINQLDIHERNHQVQQMKHIYSDASEVFIWLGLEADNSDQLFQLLGDPRIFQAYRYLLLPFIKGEYTDSERGLLNEFRISQPSPQCKNLVQQLSMNRTMWLPFVRLCQRSYWSRLWVVPEVFLARNGTLLCGKQRLSWLTFCLAKSLIRSDMMHPFLPRKNSTHPDWIQYLDASDAVRMISNWRKSRLSDIYGKFSLLELFRRFSTLKCSDPRDKVYSMLGLLPKSLQKSYISADYEVTREALALYLWSSTYGSPFDPGWFAFQPGDGRSIDFYCEALRVPTGGVVRLLHLFERSRYRRGRDVNAMKQLYHDPNLADAEPDNAETSDLGKVAKEPELYWPTWFDATTKPLFWSTREDDKTIVDHLEAAGGFARLSETRPLDSFRWTWDSTPAETVVLDFSELEIRSCNCIHCSDGRIGLSKTVLTGDDQYILPTTLVIKIAMNWGIIFLKPQSYPRNAPEYLGTGIMMKTKQNGGRTYWMLLFHDSYTAAWIQKESYWRHSCTQVYPLIDPVQGINKRAHEQLRGGSSEEEYKLHGVGPDLASWDDWDQLERVEFIKD